MALVRLSFFSSLLCCQIIFFSFEIVVVEQASCRSTSQIMLVTTIPIETITL